MDGEENKAEEQKAAEATAPAETTAAAAEGEAAADVSNPPADAAQADAGEEKKDEGDENPDAAANADGQAQDQMEDGAAAEMDGGAPAQDQMEGEGEEAVQQEEVYDFSQDQRMQKMIAHLTECLENFNEEEHWKDEHYVRLNDFLTDPKQQVLFFWNDFDEMTLRVSSSAPPDFYEKPPKNATDYQVAYFLKNRLDSHAPITAANLTDCVAFKWIGNDPLEDLLEKMNSEYMKKLLQDNDWPDGVKKEFIANLHKFMAFLNETTHAARGQTYLYIPDEDLSDIEVAAKDKDLLQRLESTVIYWTRQIKELVSNQDSPTNQAIESPLDEIAYWQKRTSNLLVLTQRLQKQELKKIIKVLEHASSSYLPGFQDLEKKIQAGHDEAQDNLQFLNTLSEPCRKIENAMPKDIPGLLPEALNYVRIIWELSKYYNTPERMKGLLTKLSNQIIKRCRAKINKADMLEGDVEKCMADLEESIDCCRKWKTICQQHQYMIKKYSIRKGWDLDTDETIFAENEAFIQRCKDLLEICEGQLQFARKGEKQVMPVFGGTKGPEYTENLIELERKFIMYLERIKELDYDILDVKITKWHDDYSHLFKDQSKSLEVMYQNIIGLTFKNISTVTDAVEMLENFDSLAKRPQVKDYVQKKAAEQVYRLFKEEIKEVEETFDGHDKAGKGPPPMPFSHPQYGGLAIWARSLIVRIDNAKNAIDSLYFIGEHPQAKDALEQYSKLKGTLDNFISTTCFNNWNDEINVLDAAHIDNKLEQPVLVRSENNEKELPASLSNNPLFSRQKKTGLLESNFDCDLHKIIVEVQYWTKIQTMGFVSIDHKVMRLLARKEHLRILRENVMLIVRDYNNIIHIIDDKQKLLFKEHLDILDRTIEPGIRRHHWGASADNFVYSCRKECQDVFLNVKRFQSNVQKMMSEFEKIAMTPLTNIQKKLYLLAEFVRQQEDTLKVREEEFINSFDKISRKVMKTYELFIHRGPKIQSEWLKFIYTLDDNLERSLKQSVKSTLLDLGKHIIGDKQRQELVPIFKVYNILDPGQAGWKIVHEPTHEELRVNIKQFMAKIIHVIRVIPRIEVIFRQQREKKIASIKKELDESEKSGGNTAAAFQKAGMRPDVNYQNLSEEEKEIQWKARWDLPRPLVEKDSYETRIQHNRKIKGKMNEIDEGIENIQTSMDEDRKHWQASEELRQLYNIRTEKGKKRILRGAQGASDQDPVQRYKESIDILNDLLLEIKNKPSQKPERFIILDCSKLKNSLTEYGMDFIQKIFQHLIQESKSELNGLLDEFKTTIDELKTPPTNLKALKKNKDLHQEVKAKLNQYEARIDPIKKKFQYIFLDQDQDIGGLEISDEDKLKLESLDEAWEKFQDGLEDASQIIQKAFTQLKQEVDNSIEDFKKECQDNKKNFSQQAPYTLEKGQDNLKAREKLQEFKSYTEELRDREEGMKFGLEIFDIEFMAYPELTLVEKEIKQLDEIWATKQEWDNQWDSWREIRINELELDEMDEVAIDFEQKLMGFDRDVRDWQVFTQFKTDLGKFRKTIPLIMDLRDPAMRERHWKELRYEVKVDFDETSDDFNLEKIISLNLLNHEEKINELADNARKQLKIEVALEDIRYSWEDDIATDLDIEKSKSKAGDQEEFYQIRSTDNIMALIEDHGVKLGGMKSSPYYKEFDTKIDHWESNIAQITETLEVLISVQGKWKYLESIFKGQADIAKQLPNEDAIFKKIHKQFKDEMERIAKEKNCLRSLIVKGFLPLLVELNGKFEQIQKNLNDLLEAKRGQFPRFYFLSNDDLLEIIGQSKDPRPIIAHIGKIFEGINDLKITQVGGNRNNKSYEIEKIISKEKEEVDIKAFHVEAKVENWLTKLIEHMKEGLRSQFYKYHAEYSQGKKNLERQRMEKAISNNKGQILITSSQMQWTTEVEAALISVQDHGYNLLKKAKQNFKKKVENYIEIVDKPGLSKLNRLKLVALIIIDEHNREIVEKLFTQRISSPRDFEWLQQLRFKKSNYENENDQQMYIACHQTNCVFDYGYEYQGNNGRLVVTPLTDRCYMTLTNALNMQRGGAPQGPAGTGKTETVKDLGKNLAFFVVIQNCSDQMDIVSIGRIFAGLALSGAWGCFDEFNRILLDVLSVVAQQVLTILEAIRKGESSTPFGELTLHVKKETGLFITMNPGYAGRSELPDNLASLFRPVAMMAPDFNAIVKISLMSEGFKQNDVLSKKVVTVYELMKKQLSKQDHYDFGMRAVKSVLNASGRIKRMSDLDETSVIIKAIRDMNLPKFIAEDVVLFDNLFIDLFPDCDEPDNSNDELQIAIEECLMRKNLQLNENLVVKIMQLYESKVTRHGNMLVGSTMSGKSKCWQILMDALNQLNAEEREKEKEKGGSKGGEDGYRYQAVKPEVINPKSVNENELFGYLDDQSPPQWSDGILSNVLKRICLEKVEQRWMILDGPVDTLWIESMNSVLDDNKLLTLTNGDRIALSANVRLLFEVENLAVASPATVSRAGMIFMDLDELGWEPQMQMWIKQKPDEEMREFLTEFVEKYLPKVLKVKRTQCVELVPTSESACVANLCGLFDALSKNIVKSPEDEGEAFKVYVEKWFVFCLIWSVGATVDESSRKSIDYILRDIESMFPHANTVFEHHLNLEKRDWASWEEKLPSNWKPTDKEFQKIIVPTVDTQRNRFIVQSLLEHGSQVLIVGHSGVGKTVLVDGILLTLDGNSSHFTINFSAGTTSVNTQEIIESNFERRAKNKYRPKNAKQRAVCFIDDLNMPRKDTFGSQPPLELIRQWIDYGFWYDRQKIVQNKIEDLQILSAMGKPGGGRAEISNRITSKFHVINYTIPSESNMKRIFETIAQLKLQVFDEEDIKQLPEPLAVSTINLFNIIQDQFLPTPAKTHYVFNMRDVSKVFQGVYQADKNFYESKEHIMKLWAHEVLRVFHDRLNSFEDRDKFKGHLNDQLESMFQLNYEENCTTNGEDAIYVNFLNDMEKQVYEEVTDFQKLREYLNASLESYNMQAKLISMDLVLFKDAIIHITKIYRVLNLKRGHAFLVGVGGSGRHSLTRLSAYIAKMNVFQLEITKGFNLKLFRDFLKTMYEMAAYKGRDKLKTVFLFSDNDVVQESFLEDIQNMLNGGVVPNLYTADELQKVRDEIRTPFKKAGNTIETPDAMNEFFFNRIKDNLHLSICMSPIGQAFRDYCRMYPALINNTTIDWFMGWPDDALTEVAQKFLNETDLDEEHKAGLAHVCAYAHSTTTDNALQMKLELKRIFYVTPTNYIELLKGYKQIILEKQTQVNNQRTKLRNGLIKLEDARIQVDKMSQEADVTKAEVQKQSKIAEELMMTIANEKKIADEKSVDIEAQRVKIGKEKEETQKLADDAEKELKQAEPALIAAQQALEKLDKKYIAEIKAFTNPPKDVETVMSAVMIVLGKETGWASVKKELTDQNFVKKIMEYDKDNVPPATLKKIEKYTKQDNFKPQYVEKISIAAGSLCQWVQSIEDYSKVLKVVAPKRARKQMAEEALKKKIEFLEGLEAEFNILQQKLAELQKQKDKTDAELKAFNEEVARLQVMIDRGEKLVTGLSGEKTRWEATLIELDDKFEKLVGDCILAAAFMSYCGPFPSDYRDGLVSTWIGTVEVQKIPHTQGFDFSDFMAGAAQAREWQIHGLPTDKFSTENGVFVTKGLRWALNIDPQTQAMNWIKRTHQDGLVIADQKDPNVLKKIEQGVIHGKQVLFLDVGEELDPVLDNVLNKSLTKVGRNYYVRIGDNEVEYNPKFKLFITTRMQNPHYTPEVSTKVTCVNFTVKQSGLEEQCLGIVVTHEQPQLENNKNEVISKIANNKNTILELEDTILRMLTESKVNLLEDVALIDTLQSSKETSDEVKTALEQAEITMKKINDTREMYRSCGKQASILFFVLNDLSKIDPMYQFSLDWYKQLFKNSIELSRETLNQDRIKTITKRHTLEVYNIVCKSLFEKHKLLLSMQMCIRLQMAEGIIDEDQWNFFLKGGQVLDRATQPPKPPFDWITEQAWDNITELEKILPDTFTGISAAIGLNNKEWHRWFLSVKPAPPESAQLPGEWETKCEDRLTKMIVLRCFRPDRVNFAIRNYIEYFMKKEFVENKPTNIRDVLEESTKEEPIIFVLSQGADPTSALRRQADDRKIEFEAISMGKGQSEKAKKILTEGAENGNWIFLANCHLSISLLPELESIIDFLFSEKSQQRTPIHENFRLMLSANPHPQFSISLLQRSLKIAQEPPKGIKSNMLRLYGAKSEFTVVDQHRAFRKAVFGLCWFHTILIERKKFKSLGWNVSYAFNDSDYSVCEDLLAIYLGRLSEDGKPIDDNYDKKAEIPWEAITYLIAAANYGGRITDDRDRRLIQVYAKEIFNNNLIAAADRWRPYGTEDLNYVYPADEANVKHPNPETLFTPEFFYEQIGLQMEDIDLPAAYGQHINAEITSQILDSNELLDSILTLTPQKVDTDSSEGSGGGIVKLITELQDRLPEFIDLYSLKQKLKHDENPLNVVLTQEIQRYNVLLKVLYKDLKQVELGVKGLVLISPELENILTALADNKVPLAWSFAYFSLKSLSNWFADLIMRYEFLDVWATKGIPFTFWIGAFTYPTGFTTSLLQKFSRKATGGAPIDKLEFDFQPVPKDANEISEHPKDGAFITGLYLEGAKWNLERSCLMEPEVMELTCPMPVLHFKPIQKRSKPPPNNYVCPCYYYPKRQGTVSLESFMLNIDIKSGDYPSEFWVKRGTAILMSLG